MALQLNIWNSRDNWSCSKTCWSMPQSISINFSEVFTSLTFIWILKCLWEIQNLLETSFEGGNSQKCNLNGVFALGRCMPMWSHGSSLSELWRTVCLEASLLNFDKHGAQRWAEGFASLYLWHPEFLSLEIEAREVCVQQQVMDLLVCSRPLCYNFQIKLRKFLH